ncbi:integrase [Sphingomonas zeicaulis]|uniref:tyrosine-type recombinase/integrase n=1 Tax=Sphingomonas zeicaulis TaxID=1632740 RepID=UPI003D24AD08
MNARTLQRIIADEMGTVGIEALSRDARIGQHRITRWSRKLPGFGIRHYYSGKSVYIVQVHMDGRLRTVTMCNTVLIGKSAALAIARRIILRAQVGENPAADRKKTRAYPFFKDFLGIYWARAAPTWKPSTLRTHNIYRRLYLDPAFGSKCMDEIDRADVSRWFAAIAAAGGPGAANRTLSILQAAFNKATAWGLRPEGSNPASGIRRYPPRRKARFLRVDELARLGRALEEDAEQQPLQVAGLRLLLLTGCRLSEIRNLTWAQVSGRRLKLVDSKTGPRTVWLGSAARAVIDQIPRARGRAELFWNDETGSFIDFYSYWSRLRERLGFGRVRVHDLRHSYASHAAAMSETLPMIGKLLGHSNIQSTVRYAHLDDSDLIATANTIGDVIADLMDNPVRGGGDGAANGPRQT